MNDYPWKIKSGHAAWHLVAALLPPPPSLPSSPSSSSRGGPTALLSPLLVVGAHYAADSERTKERKFLQTARPTDRPAFPPLSLSLSLCLECFPLRLLFFARDSIMSTASLPRSHFVFLPMSFAVHLETQFSRASGPFRVALPTFHLRRGALSRAGDDSRVLLHAVPICCVT